MSRKISFASVQGSSFSGSTLLAFLLGAHPQIATVGEMSGLIPEEDPREYRCSCGQRIEACAFWRAVEGAMAHRDYEFDVAHFGTPFRLGGSRPVQYLRHGSTRIRTLDAARDAILTAWPAERRALEALVDRNRAFIESVLEVTGKEVFLDTSKDRTRLKSFVRFSKMDVRAIHLVRDVRGVVASRLRRKPGRDAGQAARQWVKTNQKTRVALQALPAGNALLLRYEDLCQEPQGTLEQLYRFCQVDPGFQVVDFRAAPLHIIGNKMRLGSASEIRLDIRWRDLLTADQEQEVRGIARREGRRYGYVW